jgi:hypothetical protein
MVWPTLHMCLRLQAKALKNVRWYNPRTNKHSWEDPEDHTEWKSVYSTECELVWVCVCGCVLVLCVC